MNLRALATYFVGPLRRIGIRRIDQEDTHAARLDFRSQRIAEPAYGELGRAVCSVPRSRDKSPGRGDIDDVAASALQHAGQNSLCRVDGAHVVDLHDLPIRL